VAGITVGLVALPLAMAFAIASGLSPQAGIYCAIITGFLISALGGSRFQIGGPTGAFVVVIAGIVSRYGVDGLFMCTLMAGVMLVVMGLTGTGSAVKYIPRPVIVGFTNGIAVVIASTQLKDFLGLTIDIPGEFLERLRVIGANFDLVLAQYRPGHGFAPDHRARQSLPAPHPRLHRRPVRRRAGVGRLRPPRGHGRFTFRGDSRRAPTLRGASLPAEPDSGPAAAVTVATGAIASTATNIRSGARTPVAGILHAVTLLVILLYAAPLAAYVPLPVLAAILFVVARNMGEWGEIPELLKHSYTDVAVWLATFSLTVLADLTVAVEVGMVLAALLFIRRVARTTTVSRVTPDYIRAGWPHILQGKDIPANVAVFRIHGPFLFGATDKLLAITEDLESLPPVVILRLRNTTAIDATGLSAIADLADALRASQRTLIVCGAPAQPTALMHRAEFEGHLGQGNICENVDRALARARDVLSRRPTSG